MGQGNTTSSSRRLTTWLLHDYESTIGTGVLGAIGENPQSLVASSHRWCCTGLVSTTNGHIACPRWVGGCPRVPPCLRDQPGKDLAATLPRQAGGRRHYPPWAPPGVNGAACEGQTHHYLTKCAPIDRVDRLR